MNFTRYYFEIYYDSLKCYEDMAYDIDLKNAVESYFYSENNNFDDEEHINGPFIEINRLYSDFDSDSD